MRPTNELKAELRGMLRGARDSAHSIINPDKLPNEANTDGQRALINKHGSPRVFALAIIAAIGEISVADAQAAVNRYLEEWDQA